MAVRHLPDTHRPIPTTPLKEENMSFAEGLLVTLAEPRPDETELVKDQDGAVVGIDWAHMIKEGLVK